MVAQDAAGVNDVTDLIEFYDTSRKPSQKPEVGQVVSTPVLHSDHKPHQIADAKRSDPTSHGKTEIVIRPVDDRKDFRGKSDRLPLYNMALGLTEELVITRAKKRPCVILAKADSVDHTKLPQAQKGKALNAFGEAYLLAPIYSVSTADKTRAFGPVMTARVKCMMYPQFVYVPQSGLIIKNQGVMRLDRLFWSHLVGATDPEPLFLTPQILGICWNQIGVLSGKAPEKDYTEMRDLLLAYLPDDCK